MATKVEEINKLKKKNLHFRQCSADSLSNSSMQFDLSGLNTPVGELATSNLPSPAHPPFGELHQESRTSNSSAMHIENVVASRLMYNEVANGSFALEPKNILVVTKPRKHSLVYKTAEITKYILTIGTPETKVYVDMRLARSKRFSAHNIAKEANTDIDRIKYWNPYICLIKPSIFDLAITIGDNSTLLYTSWLFQKIGPPVLSFSDDDVPGFLTHFSLSNYQQHLYQVLTQNVSLRFCSRLQCSFHKYDEKTKQYSLASTTYSLDEILISRGEHPFISNLNVYNNSELMTVVQADGLVVATPTGSTNISANAGGSLVHPALNAILVTPVCPHTLSFRPIILPDYNVLNVEIPLDSRSSAFFSVDRHESVEMHRGDYLSIVTSHYPFTTIQNPGYQWTKVLEDKFNWNVRERQKPFSRKPSLSDVKDTSDDKFDITDNSYCREFSADIDG
ncbi:NAD/NADH kinase [Schizosaccharomyces pombe]|uniref:Uncharacterized kinase C24B10.02c n=1 Tax=Schizosaccharomyces pombe (strain 972 / ATCC 24843) TaxID=284812 RepID=YJN2_SCHPO|nr:putative NAD/NADH kinase [Schizosaccharomyces pombe]Q9P7K3.1 RecName: Full=Uncharacterized kinase C24B10.02c [Schizosaccharomyces pombe 972h-]CAB76211.1 NAD/NADH kinase (predicted) [Schizosaccharomyces pombe]|eukprot:NP_588005.1 putative NAD/NADH kinase [Schizosaccharomyces pombe]